MSAKRSNLTFTPTSRYTHIPPGLLSPNNQEFSHEKNSSPLYWFPSLFVLATFVLWLTPATSSTTPGTIYEWGAFAGKAMGGFGPGAINYEYRLVPTAWEGDDWSQLSLAGGTALHAMAIRSDGSLWGLGSNAIGQIGTGSAGGGVEEPSQIGNDHNWKEAEVDNAGSWLLKKDGTLWVTGWILTEDNVREFLYEPIRFGNDSDWTKILAARGGVPHVLAIKADGSLWAWGDNTSGQLGIGVEGGSYAIPQRVGSANDWQSIAAGNAFSLAIKSDGTLWAWGHWGLGSLGIGSDPQTTPINQPIRVGENFNWVSVSAGAAHSLAIKADGTLWAWGDNRQGQTGTGSAEGLLFSPVQVGIESDWAAVSASPTNHSLAIKTNGSLWAWGENRRGELGIGYMGYETYSTPTRVGEENHWVAVATGHFRSAAIAVHSEAEEEVASWQKPDFFLAAITLDPQPVETGATFSATVTVRNDGHVAGDAGMLRLWLNQSGLVAEGTAGDYELVAGTIEAGETVEYTFPGLTAPANSGTYHLRAFIDADGQTAEYSTGNNQLPRAYTLAAAPGTEIPSWMKPDFVVPSLFLTPQPSTVGARFQAVIRVTNIGDIPGDARELAVWTRSPSWHNLADTPDVIIPLGTLAVDEVLEFTIEDLQAPMAPGTFFVRAIVNPHGATAEKSLGNNQGGATYTIQPVVLRISVLPSGGNQLSWNGTPNFEYWVERSTTLPGGFSILAGPLPGTAPQTVFVDESPPAGGTVFYRVWGVQP